MIQKNFRHGDVVIKQIDSIPKEAIDITPEKGDLILAEGEATGHAHRFPEGAGKLFKYNEKTYLKVTKERKALTHEEHLKGELPIGIYEISIQQDYEPSGWKRVID